MIDFDKEFSDFVTDTGSSAIQDIYKMIPALSQEQLQIVQALKFYSKRYHLDDLDMFTDMYLEGVSKNKNLNFLKSIHVKNLLKAYTQEELIRGIKVNRQSVSEE